MIGSLFTMELSQEFRVFAWERDTTSIKGTHLLKRPYRLRL